MDTVPQSDESLAPDWLKRFLRPPMVGALAFVLVLSIVPLMHSFLSLIRSVAGAEYRPETSIVIGVVAVLMVLYAARKPGEAWGTWFGFIAGHLVWLGWVELSFSFNAEYMEMGPLVVAGEVQMPASLTFIQSTTGILLATMPFFLFNKDSRCNAFRWIQRICRMDLGKPDSGIGRNFARITFLETLYVIWFCYACSLFMIDDRFLGVHHPVTYAITFGLMAWTVYLLFRLSKFTRILAGIRYAIPTAGIFWTTVEIMSSWGLYDEFWSHPQDYILEFSLMLGAFTLAVVLAVLTPQRRQSDSVD